MSDNHGVHELELKIIDVCEGEPPENIFKALKGALVFHLSLLLCPVQRKDVAAYFKQNIPAMLNEAEQIAARVAAEMGRRLGYH